MRGGAALPLGPDLCASLDVSIGGEAWSEVRYVPLPSRSTCKAFARRLCPDLIMHPQPVSEENPPWLLSWLLRRTLKLMAVAACGS